VNPHLRALGRKPLTKQGLEKLVRSRSFRGERPDRKGGWIPRDHPDLKVHENHKAIVTEAQWEAAQWKRPTKKARLPYGTNLPKGLFNGTGKLRCEGCDLIMAPSGGHESYVCQDAAECEARASRAGRDPNLGPAHVKEAFLDAYAYAYLWEAYKAGKFPTVK